jgi:hypothetical protein
MSSTQEFDPQGREIEHLKAHLRWALPFLRAVRHVIQGGYAGQMCVFCSGQERFSAQEGKPETHSRDCPYKAALEAAK